MECSKGALGIKKSPFSGTVGTVSDFTTLRGRMKPEKNANTKIVQANMAMNIHYVSLCVYV